MRLFRLASPASASWNAAKTLAQIVAFWGFFLFFLPPKLEVAAAGLVSSLPMVPARWVTGVMFCGGSLLGLWSAWTMVLRGHGTPLPLDTARELVVSGPYRVVRNPMALAGVVQGVSVALWHRSWVNLAFFLGGAALWHIMVRPIEERDLLSRFGKDYADYRSRTGLWWPRRRHA